MQTICLITIERLLNTNDRPIYASIKRTAISRRTFSAKQIDRAILVRSENKSHRIVDKLFRRLALFLCIYFGKHSRFNLCPTVQSVEF